MNAFLSLWAGLLVGVLGVALSVVFYLRQKYESNRSGDEAKRMSRELTTAHEEIKGLRESTERSERRHTPVHVRLDQPAPAESVNRPEIKSEILGELFVNKRNMVVVYGEFGAGKTWLAREIGKVAVGEDGHFAPFEHGLLAATLGPSPAIPHELRRWHEAVTAAFVPVAEDGGAHHDNHLPTVPWPDAKTSEKNTGDTEERRLAGVIESRLTGRYPLVIIDDAWRYADVEALLAAVPERPVLITTRELEVRRSLVQDGASEVNLRGLTPAQVASLLAALISPALDGEPTPKVATFLDHLSGRIGRDPYTVTQTGAEVRARLQAHGGSWRALSQQRLDKLAAEAESWSGAPGQQDRDGGQVFAERLERLTDPLQLAVLRTLSLLRPRPEQFSATEIAALCLPGDGAGHDTSGTLRPDLSDIEDALDFLDKACYLESSPNEFRYSLHNLSREVLREHIGAQVGQDFDIAAVKYWLSWVDPRDPDTHIDASTSYEIAIDREGEDWLRAARNLIYHLSRLDDRGRARQTFTAIYFELFFWWGFYLRYPALEEWVRDWQAMRETRGGPPDDDDKEWFAATLAFHRGFTPGHRTAFSENDPDWLPSEPDYRGEGHDWPAVTEALRTILRLTRLDGPVDSLHEHDQWHARALIDNYLADSYRYRPRSGRFAAEIDAYYAEARRLIMRCNQYDADHHRKPACDWMLSWVDRETADVALNRALDAPDEVTRTRQLKLAKAGAAAAIRAVLAGADGTALTEDRAELDYETAALASLISGDACVLEAAEREAARREAARWYAAAVVLAAAWNYRPVTDDYTRMFSGHVSEHVRAALRELLEPGPDGPGQADDIAVLHVVLQSGYGGGWGSEPLRITSVKTDVLKDPRQFMKLLIGPFPDAGQHDVTDLIPDALDQVTERTLVRVWDAARRTPPADSTEPAAVSQPGEPAAAVSGQAGAVPPT
jgi:hypothetical protein